MTVLFSPIELVNCHLQYLHGGKPVFSSLKWAEFRYVTIYIPNTATPVSDLTSGRVSLLLGKKKKKIQVQTVSEIQLFHFFHCLEKLISANQKRSSPPKNGRGRARTKSIFQIPGMESCSPEAHKHTPERLLKLNHST